MDLTRDAPDVARAVVTVAPDVASSTNLSGWLNKGGRMEVVPALVELEVAVPRSMPAVR